MKENDHDFLRVSVVLSKSQNNAFKDKDYFTLPVVLLKTNIRSTNKTLKDLDAFKS